VYSLELARLYNYFYQQEGRDYTIIHSLDGYDEISLTSDFKYIHNGIEEIIVPESLGYKRFLPEDLRGGKTVQEAVTIFLNVLNGKGTEAQRGVVIANSQFALKCYYPSKTLEECKDMAERSLYEGKAIESLNQLIGIQ
jgi:anthranilate phosphoribosyltransferase